MSEELSFLETSDRMLGNQGGNNNHILLQKGALNENLV